MPRIVTAHKKVVIAVLALAATAAAAFGLHRPGAAVGADQPATNVIGTLSIDGLTTPDKPIRVLAYSWGLSNPVVVGSTGGGVGSGKANIQDLFFTKYMDTLSPQLVQAVASGQIFGSATLLVNVTGIPGNPTHRYTLHNLALSSDSEGGTGGQRATENLTITFETFEFANVT